MLMLVLTCLRDLDNDDVYADVNGKLLYGIGVVMDKDDGTVKND